MSALCQKQTSGGPIDDHDHFDTYFDDVQACDELLACLANGPNYRPALNPSDGPLLALNRRTRMSGVTSALGIEAD